VTNGVEIEELLLSNGFVAVEPEKLTFAEQMALFSNVEEVVGSSGAALANLIFLPPTSAVNILIGKLSGTSYWYWQNIACASGKRVNYVLGNIGTSGAGIHSNFSIDIECIAQKMGIK
jgi:capsular polysaccharide biosynthesis protein